MKFTLEIDLENAAFFYEDSETDLDGRSIANLLHQVANRVADEGGLIGTTRTRIRDVNGNTCGHWQIV
jgi:hypothetical protein